MPEDETPSDTERQVSAWRLLRLSQLGFAGAILDVLADSPADLHVAERLIDGGCPLETAARILI